VSFSPSPSPSFSLPSGETRRRLRSFVKEFARKGCAVERARAQLPASLLWRLSRYETRADYSASRCCLSTKKESSRRKARTNLESGSIRIFGRYDRSAPRVARIRVDERRFGFRGDCRPRSPCLSRRAVISGSDHGRQFTMAPVIVQSSVARFDGPAAPNGRLLREYQRAESLNGGLLWRRSTILATFDLVEVTRQSRQLIMFLVRSFAVERGSPISEKRDRRSATRREVKTETPARRLPAIRFRMSLHSAEKKVSSCCVVSVFLLPLLSLSLSLSFLSVSFSFLFFKDAIPVVIKQKASSSEQRSFS